MAKKKEEELEEKRYTADSPRAWNREDAGLVAEREANRAYQLGLEDAAKEQVTTAAPVAPQTAAQLAADAAALKQQQNRDAKAWTRSATTRRYDDTSREFATDAAGTINKGETAAKGATMSQDVLDSLVNGEKFTYDLATDPKFQYYKQLYENEGKLAMKDTFGQAAALTGGWGNSYAEGVAQQAYAAQQEKLYDRAAEFEDRAYNRYRDERADLRDTYNVLYGRERDALADERYADELKYSRDRDAEADKRYYEERDYDRARYADETAYARSRDAEADRRYYDERDYDRARYADELAYARSRDAEADRRYYDERDYDRARYADETAYARSRDAEADRRYYDERDYDRAKYADETAYARDKYEDETAYNRSRDAEADKKYYEERDYTRSQEEKDLAYKYYVASKSSSGSSDSPTLSNKEFNTAVDDAFEDYAAAGYQSAAKKSIYNRLVTQYGEDTADAIMDVLEDKIDIYYLGKKGGQNGPRIAVN